jgi:hypothetical protein
MITKSGTTAAPSAAFFDYGAPAGSCGGLLPPEGHDDPEAVSEALYAFFDRALTRDA